MHSPEIDTPPFTDPRPIDLEEAVDVAFGDRREEIHFEPDPEQLVVASHLVRPASPVLEDETAGARAVEADVPPVEDVRVAPEGPSVWDARPPADDADEDGEPTGH
jgi:hypothetical protein